jgi:hypothetical protein
LAKRTQENSAHRLEAVEKEAEALRLRIAGLTMAQIAERLGYADPSGALKAVKAGIRRACLLPAEELRSVQVARYEKLIVELLGQVLQPEGWPSDKVFVPSLKALDRLLKVFQQLEKVAGLDIIKVAPTEPDGTTSYKPYAPSTEQAAGIFAVLAQYGIIGAGTEEGSNT